MKIDIEYKRVGDVENLVASVTPKEFADFVLVLQGQRIQDKCFRTDIHGKCYNPSDVMSQSVRQAIDGIDREGG